MKYEKYIHERNYKCRIREYIYKGLKTVSMENELIKITILADKGTDICEFLYKPKDIDFMWHSFNGVRNPAEFVSGRVNPDGDFIDFYEGGWQELFPNIGSACVYKGALLGNHGEVCLLPWVYRIEADTPEEISVKFSVRTYRTPYYLEKTLTIRENDATLYINEKIVNEGMDELEFMWGHHPAFGQIFLDETCEIKLPEKCITRTIDADLGRNAPLPRDTEFKWPVIFDETGRKWDLEKVPASDSKLFFMFYAFELLKGEFSIINRKHGLGFKMEWDKDIFPYIWVWAPYGGCENYPWYGRNYNLAIEPWSAIPDNLEKVIESGKGIRIKPKEEIKTSIQAKAFCF